MVLPKKYAQDILAPILSRLDPDQLHEQEEIVEADGSQMMAMGMNQDINGNPILHNVIYVYSRTVVKQVNHQKNLICLIEAAGNLEQMQNYLAEYLVRYGKPPAHLQTIKSN
jgi:hypothetical protein